MKIDYVIAWVNGNDPKHRDLRKAFPPEDSVRNNEDVVGDIRFTESGEIYYNIVSVIENAPFVDSIYIVTDNQEPRLIDRIVEHTGKPRDFIKIVSHREIFDGLDAALPNFSSLSIESALWRIDSLSEHFIYSNDDMFLNSPTSEADFFQDGKPVLRGKWCKPEQTRFKNVVRSKLRKLIGRGPNTNPTYRKSLDNGAIAAGSKDGFLTIGHHPHPIRKSTLQSFFQEKPELLNRQVKHRYRSAEQFNPTSLANHLEIMNHNVRFRGLPSIAYFDPRKMRRFAKNSAKLKSHSVAFGCIQSLEKIPLIQARELHEILCDKFKGALPPEIREFLMGQVGRPDGRTVQRGQGTDLGLELSYPAVSRK